MIREKLIEILVDIDQLTKEEIVEQLKKLIMDKDITNVLGDILDDVDIDQGSHSCICLPSICIGNKCDAEAKIVKS
jgi:hypothetical protein